MILKGLNCLSSAAMRLNHEVNFLQLLRGSYLKNAWKDKIASCVSNFPLVSAEVLGSQVSIEPIPIVEGEWNGIVSTKIKMNISHHEFLDTLAVEVSNALAHSNW